MATEAPTTSAPQADTFDPAAWLSHFEAVGGGYSASEARTSLCIAYHGSTGEDQRAANALVNQLAQDDRCRVIGLIRARSGLALQSVAHGADQPYLKPECLESVSEHRPDGAASGSDIADASKGPQDMNMMSAICVAELNAALPSDIADITSEHPIGLSDAMAHYRDAAKRGLEYQAIFNAAERVATDPNDPVLATVEQAWATALHSQADAWRALSRAQVSTLGELQQKIAIVRADAMLDGDSGEGLPIIDALDADIQRLRGSGPDRSKSEWGGALAAFSAAHEAAERHDQLVYSPLTDELKRIAPRPELEFRVEAQSGQITEYTLWPRQLHAYDCHASPKVRQAAAELREVWLSHRAAGERLGVDAAAEELERLSAVECEKEEALILMPSPDLAALLFKMERLWGAEARDADGASPSWCAEWVNAVMADARRLLAA